MIHLTIVKQDNSSLKKVQKMQELWINGKIHKYGSTRLPKDTLLAVCGREVTAKPLIQYFKEKYPLK